MQDNYVINKYDEGKLTLREMRSEKFKEITELHNELELGNGPGNE